MASANPQLIAAIRRFAGSNAPLTLATALVESGGRLDAVGDHGRSFGPYQEYDLGRGAGIPVAQRENPIGSTQRFLKDLASAERSGFSGAEAAYRAQRPADHAGYVAKIKAALPQARALLGQSPAPSARRTSQAGGGPPALPSAVSDPARALLAMQAINEIGQGGVQPSTLLSLAEASRQASETVPSPTSSGPPKPAAPRGATNSGGRVLGEKSLKVIGTPYTGTHTLGNWESDDAVDIAAPVGTPIYAVGSGTIGSQFGSLGEGGRFAGLRLHLKTPGNEWYYAHLSKFAPGIKPGAKVQRGQLLGYSGEANGVGHLHLGVEHGNPLAILGLK